MGKRSAKKAPQQKKRATVATVFNCPFCNHKDAIEVKIDRAACVGKIKCRSCTAAFECRCESLHEPIDVYSEWIDQCQTLEQTKATPAGAASLVPVATARNDEDDEDE